MQINRLFEIVYLLLSRKRITAKELAEHCEVSVRTILRDLETLSAAGIPVYTVQGKGGGISPLDRYVLNKALLSEEEQQARFICPAKPVFYESSGCRRDPGEAPSSF
ncbi:HTH domain-containing protein [Paenibacillus sp. P25]|nr:HTH domain-containing protein [Paenibacillus sp. P25]